ncbi:MAG: cell division protein SepF [Bacillota bacterium]|nr:cell division protein SepF [Bacillota bacterium]
MSEKFFDKVKYIVGLGDGEYDDEEFVEVKNSEPEPAPKSTITPFPKDNFREGKSADLKSKAQMKLIVNEPSAFEDCSKIADNLKNKKPVIINLEKLETEIAKRIFDFVSGATYALDGSVQKVANNIFVFAPDNVDITSNIEEFKSLNSSNLFK